MSDEAQIKVNIELDIPKADYIVLTQWLKHHVADNTIENTLEYGVKMRIAKWLPKARRHFETGKDALQRFRDTLFEGDEDE